MLGFQTEITPEAIPFNFLTSCVHATLLLWYLTHCNPMDYSPPGSSVLGILQARILKWVAFSFSRGSSWSRNQTCVSYVSCVGRQVLHHWHHLGSPFVHCHCQLLSCVWLLLIPWTAACQASLSITNSRSLLKLMSIELMMPSNHLILCRPLLLPPSIFAAGGQSIGVSASASVLPINIQEWFPLGLTGLISLLSKRLSRVFSNTMV